MNRILFVFFVFGPLTIPFAGCVSQAQMNMQRALFDQEYRQLEDELFLTYQNMDRLEKSNTDLRAQLGQEFQDNQDYQEYGGRPSIRPRRSNAPSLAPISTEGMQPSEGLPGILLDTQSRSMLNPLPQMVEQAHYNVPEFASRPRKPSGNTTAELPIWRPQR